MIRLHGDCGGYIENQFEPIDFFSALISVFREVIKLSSDDHEEIEVNKREIKARRLKNGNFEMFCNTFLIEIDGIESLIDIYEEVRSKSLEYLDLLIEKRPDLYSETESMQELRELATLKPPG